MIYSRINLKQTNYSLYENFVLFNNPPVKDLQKIYYKYCSYKNFKSVMPIFNEEFVEPSNDVIGYYHNNILVAFSLIKKFNSKNAEAMQFAWDYESPNLNLGIKSLKSECALYKSLGFEYYYLGSASEYKKQIDGFEILGPV